MALAYDGQPDEQALAQEQEQARREEKLVRMLKAEEEDALGYAQTEVAEQQMEALRRYFGEKYGDEEDGRSQVTTREVFEAIENIRPDLHRVVAGTNVVSLVETSPADSQYAKQAADVLHFIYWDDNQGFENTDSFILDGLLHRRGYLAVYWCDYEYRAPQTLTGLNIMQVQQLMADPNVEILAQDFETQSEAGGISLVVRRVKSPAKAVIEAIAPEDMRLNSRAVSIDDARYVGRVLRMLRGEIAQKWPQKAEQIRQYSGGEGAAVGAVRRSEDVRAERFQDDDIDWTDSADEAADELEVLEEYLRVDLDGDGYPELIRSYRLGDFILDETEVDENPFASWTPIRIPHRFQGLSMHDITADLQRISTVLTRAGLDAVYQSVVNREAFDATKIEADGPINSTYTGTKIPVQGDPNGAILPLTGGLNTATVAWDALELTARRIEDRTGVTRQARGLDSDQLTKEHSGAALRQLSMSADGRKELMARNLASGLSDLFSKLYRLICRNQNQPRTAKIAGQWVEFDPSTWNSDCRVTIHSGGMNREQTLVGLQMIGQEQAQVIELLGPMNPNVKPQNRYRYQEELCRIAGFKDAEQFFSEVPPDWQPPEQEDPAMAKVKADTAAKQAEMQLKGQETAAKLQMEQQKDAASLQSDREKAALDLQLARDKAQAEMDLANRKAEAEFELARAKMEMELQLAREKMVMESELERERIASQERVAAAASEEQQLSKNRPGGSLSE